MNPQDERDYLRSMSHLTDVQLLKESDELQECLTKNTIAEDQKEILKDKTQIIFGAILRREAFDEMSMDELNKCISDNERERNELEETVDSKCANIYAEQAYWNAYIWEADARAEFMRRMERIVHAAFTEESSEECEEESSDGSE